MMEIRTGGRGTATDVELVRAELGKFPAAELAMLATKGIGVVACWDSVVDHLPELANDHPRNWNPGTNWTLVPGCYDPEGRDIVIATVPAPGGGRMVPPKGVKHGSWNLVLHEAMHADDYSAGRQRCHNPSFVAARNRTLARSPVQLSEYESRPDQAGHEETYAETAARYFGSDPTMIAKLPDLHSFWAGATLPLEPGSSEIRRGGKPAPIGTATLLDNGNIELDLRAESDTGIIGHALFELSPEEEGHAAIRDRISPPGRRDRPASRTITIEAF